MTQMALACKAQQQPTDCTLRLLCASPPPLLQGTAGGFAVQFGASKDSQTAADTQALAGGSEGPAVHATEVGRYSTSGLVYVHAAWSARSHSVERAVAAPVSQCRQCLPRCVGLLLCSCPPPRNSMRCPAHAGNASTGAATYCFIQAIERRGTKLT